jgi:hypothetical protein
MLNKTQLKAAVKKYGALKESKTRDEARNEIMDSLEFSPEDTEQILAAIYDVAITSAASAKVESKGPNDELDLSSYDYKNLVGKAFKEYVSLTGDRSFIEFDKETGKEIPVVGQLRQDDHYDFSLFRVDVVRKERFPGIKGTPIDFIGVKVKSDTPDHTTRIPVRMALEYNMQILNAHSVAGHGKYYLLKK